MTAVGTAHDRALKCACGEVWSHPAVRLLVGPAFRPGGRALTEHLVELAALRPGDRVLDVGCGAGDTVATLAGRGLRAVGVDYSRDLAAQAAAAGPALVGDAEALPVADGAFDAVAMECVLSLFPDKRAALAGARRALVREGMLLLTDVSVDGELPEPLASVLGWIGCVGGALATDGYRALLEASGFRVEAVRPQPDAVAGFVARVRRRLALLQGGLAVGLVGTDGDGLLPLDALAPGGPLAQLADVVFGQAAACAADGRLGYVAVLARRRS